MKTNILIFCLFLIYGPSTISSFLLDICDCAVKYYLCTRDSHGRKAFDLNTNFDNPKAPLIVIVHGWKTPSDANWISNLTEAYLEKEESNILIMDWSAVSNSLYAITSLAFRQVADSLAVFLRELADRQDVNLREAHLIGDSIAAHLLGYAARQLNGRYRIGRITGLDPTGLQFNFLSGLAAGDAELVVAIHTSMILGVWWKSGDIDFYPNGGRDPQPGCLKLFCSHNRSFWLFVESVRNKDAFRAEVCGGALISFNPIRKQITLGGDLKKTDAGSYCFQTRSEPPYSLITSTTLQSFLNNTYNQLLRLFRPNDPSTPNYNITFELYTRQIDGFDLSADDTHYLNDTNPLYFIIHGWQTVNFTWMQEMKDALLIRENCDVILVNWTQESNIEYLTASVTTKYIGEIIGCMIHYLHESYATNMTTIHLIGHSLGAHVAGNAGRTARNLTGIPVGRLTGLDPAGPLFNFLLDEVRLRRTDADLVDVIHTDDPILGTFRDLGDVEFYPNGGRPPQPGCDDNIVYDLTSCSHSRSYELYIEAISDEDAFLSTLCSSYYGYLDGDCSGNKNITIGGIFGIDDSGSYYCNTKGEYPYSYS